MTGKNSLRNITLFAALALVLPLQNAQATGPDHGPTFPNTQQKDEAQAMGQPRHDLIQGEHVEGHIAFLHAELDITPAQENLWNAVAEAMREDVTNLRMTEDNAAARMHGPENAVQYLHNRAIFARLHAEGEERFLAAFQPLYERFSSQQKQAADDLFIPDDR